MAPSGKVGRSLDHCESMPAFGDTCGVRRERCIVQPDQALLAHRTNFPVRFVNSPGKPGGKAKSRATNAHCPSPTRPGRYAQQKTAPEVRIATTWPRSEGM